MCQRIKVDTSKPVGLLLPLPIPVKPWVDISMDFVEGLPKSMGYEVVFFVVDRLIKYVHFLPLSHPFTTTKVASVFMKEIFRSHGMQLLLLSYGRSCLDYKALTQPCHLLTIHSPMDKLKWLIKAQNIISGPLLMINLTPGLLGYIWQNTSSILISIHH